MTVISPLAQRVLRIEAEYSRSYPSSVLAGEGDGGGGAAEGGVESFAAPAMLRHEEEGGSEGTDTPEPTPPSPTPPPEPEPPAPEPTTPEPTPAPEEPAPE